jgi:hypothetical protein
MSVLEKISAQIEAVGKLYQAALRQRQFQAAAKLLDAQQVLRDAVAGWNCSFNAGQAMKTLTLTLCFLLFLSTFAPAQDSPTAFIPATPPGPTPPAPLEARPELELPAATPNPAIAAATVGRILANGDLVLPLTGSVTIPSNSLAVVNLTIVTNVNVTYQFVTNVYPITYVLTSPPAGTLTPLFGNVIDPAIGRRLVKTITGATGLTISSFNDTNWATVYLINPNRYPVTWPSTNQVNYRPGGRPPDPSDPYPIVYFESVLGRITASQ